MLNINLRSNLVLRILGSCVANTSLSWYKGRYAYCSCKCFPRSGNKALDMFPISWFSMCERKTRHTSIVATFASGWSLKVNPNPYPIPSTLLHTVEYLVLFTGNIIDTLLPEHPVILYGKVASSHVLRPLGRFVSS